MFLQHTWLNCQRHDTIISFKVVQNAKSEAFIFQNTLSGELIWNISKKSYLFSYPAFYLLTNRTAGLDIKFRNEKDTTR